MRHFEYIDLFAGLGGFHLAASALGGVCVFASEIQADLQVLYEKNFGIKPYGDINNVDIKDIPEHELLCAGFPCQPFSKAGSQSGWKDAVRGTVFFKIVEILEARLPAMVLLENVPNFIKHDQGNTFKTVLFALSQLGYDVETNLLSPHHFGVPQIRERLFILGRLKRIGGLSAYKWPKPGKVSPDVRTVLDRHPTGIRMIGDGHIKVLETWQEFLELLPVSAKLPYFPIWSCEYGATYPYDRGALERMTLSELSRYRGSFGQRLVGRSKEEVLSKIPGYARMRGRKVVFPKWKQEFIRQNREFFALHKTALRHWIKKVSLFDLSFQKFEWNCQGEPRDLWRLIIQLRASGVRVKRPDSAPSLVAMTSSQVPIIGWEQRYMTSRECARLQSMDALQHLPNTVSSSCKALGNAVNVKVVRSIIRPLLDLPCEYVGEESNVEMAIA